MDQRYRDELLRRDPDFCREPDERFAPADRFEPPFFFGGTLAPFFRASERTMAHRALDGLGGLFPVTSHHGLLLRMDLRSIAPEGGPAAAYS